MMSTSPRRLLLASQSPRRRELLRQIGVAFEVLPWRAPPRADPALDETRQTGEVARDYVCRIARTKAEFGNRLLGLRRLPPAIVLAADTVVEVDGDALGKPRDASDAEAMLARLSGREHQVRTAIALAWNGVLHSAESVSTVRFRHIDPSEIRRYALSGEPLDKAGAYAIQGYAAVFVEWLNGSYSGVMGLPLFELAALLRRVGYPI